MQVACQHFSHFHFGNSWLSLSTTYDMNSTLSPSLPIYFSARHPNSLRSHTDWDYAAFVLCWCLSLRLHPVHQAFSTSRDPDPTPFPFLWEDERQGNRIDDVGKSYRYYRVTRQVEGFLPGSLPRLAQIWSAYIMVMVIVWCVRFSCLDFFNLVLSRWLCGLPVTSVACLFHRAKNRWTAVLYLLSAWRLFFQSVYSMRDCELKTNLAVRLVGY